ncbi:MULTISPECIES: hypothetical protein [Pseudomonas]|jgi:purine-cytosine permease-like protein|uniref:Integral membrane protein n=1 Tax=Pseudomonas promysalinigenes TaxID=485898 RepID=A0ABY6AG87_9PSED|nr:hypothetical protein [Pseudomonas promysalinigenes]UXH37835.1 hypothetical protein N5C08_12540 [Pseudomonas promysalinigenes]
MVWWLEILTQFLTSTALAVCSIFIFWAYMSAFGRTYTRLLSTALAVALLSIAAFPHGVSLALSHTMILGEGREFLLLLADAMGVVSAVIIASFFFNPERLLDDADCQTSESP